MNQILAQNAESLDAMKARIVVRMAPGGDGYASTIEWLKAFVEGFGEKEHFSTIDELFVDRGGALGFDECFDDAVEEIFAEEMKSAGFERGSDEWEDAREVFSEARGCGEFSEHLQVFQNMEVQEFCNTHGVEYDKEARASFLNEQEYSESLKNNAVDWAKSVAIECERLTDEQVKTRAVEDFNTRLLLAEKPASLDSDQRFLERICVNFIRHNLSNYDALLQSEERADSDSASAILSARVYTLIGANYPMLATECNRQRKLRNHERQRALAASLMPRF
ncbi:MAG: hypothetical protein ING69_10575 [Rhodocyclaceae bacterium]|nr:hypothetical protein [Rhodocyclaceae bacterium]